MTEESLPIAISMQDPVAVKALETLCNQLPGIEVATDHTKAVLRIVESEPSPSGKGREEEKMLMLGVGVLAYPLSISALLHAIWTEVGEAWTACQRRLELATDIWLDVQSKTVQKGKAIAELAEKEVAMLHYLHRHPAGIKHGVILQAVWGYDPQIIETNTLETHLYRLRKKLREAQIMLEVENRDGILRLLT